MEQRKKDNKQLCVPAGPSGLAVICEICAPITTKCFFFRIGSRTNWGMSVRSDAEYEEILRDLEEKEVGLFRAVFYSFKPQETHLSEAMSGKA